MSERFTFICLLDRELSADERRWSIEAVVSCVARCADAQGQLVSLVYLDDAGNQIERPWQENDPLMGVTLGVEDLLVAYFRVQGQGDERLESVSIESRLARTVLTLSVSCSVLGSTEVGAPAVLAGLAQWLLLTCNSAVLACGPELDLYEVGDQKDILTRPINSA